MKVIPLSLQAAALMGFSHMVIVDPTDLSETATGTAQTLQLLPVVAGDIVDRVAVYLETPLTDASDGAFNTCLIKVGDGDRTDRYLANKEANGNGTEIVYADGSGGERLYEHPLTSLATGLSTAAIDIMTNYTPGFDGDIIGFKFITTVAGTGASASQVFNLEVNTTNLTGGLLTLTLASQATIGTITSATAITGGAHFGPTDTISIEMAASGTVFTAGAGYFVIEMRATDGQQSRMYTVADTVDLVVGSQTGKSLSEIDGGRIQVLIALRPTGKCFAEAAL